MMIGILSATCFAFTMALMGFGAANDDVVVIYSPHPDDEILSFASKIMNATKGEVAVHVVMLTRGGASGAIHAVNQRLESMGEAPIGVETFMEARNREATLAL